MGTWFQFEEETLLEIDGGYGCPIISILLFTLNCKLKGGYNSNFTLCLFCQNKIKKRKTLLKSCHTISV